MNIAKAATIPTCRSIDMPKNAWAGSRRDRPAAGTGLPALTALIREDELEPGSCMRALAPVGRSSSKAPLISVEGFARPEATRSASLTRPVPGRSTVPVVFGRMTSAAPPSRATTTGAREAPSVSVGRK